MSCLSSRHSLTDLSLQALEAWLTEHDYKTSHAVRLLRRAYQVGPNPDGSRKFPAALEASLAEAFLKESTAIAQRQTSKDGTTKLLLRLHDGRTIESVLMPDYHPERASGCISSQVGCAMGCDFCATTKTGFDRNLTSGEILEQWIRLREEARIIGRTLRTIVFMGMGEPMLNLNQVIPAIERMGDPQLGAFGWRQITVSTVGIIPGIEQLQQANLGVHLALSLHAPDDETRARLLPMGQRFGVKQVLEAADRYQASSGRITTIQYCLLEGINDSLSQARELAQLLQGRRMHVNLLRYNPTGISLNGHTYAPSSIEKTGDFLNELRRHRIVAHLRRARGPDIDAACGQLRKRENEGEN